MESIVCDIHRRTGDKNLLLDDENVGSSSNCNLCLRLRSDSNQLNGPLFNIKNINNWQEREISISNSLFLTANSAESRLSINSGDSTDAPLLLREHYNDYDNMEEFHCHFNTAKKQDNKALKKLLAASGMCLFFMIAEIIGGYLANSLSIMTDAAHLLSDFIGFLVSVFSIWLGQHPSTKRNSWGFHRAEVLGALFSIIFIWLLTAIFTYLAIVRLINGKYDIDANTMILCATIGVFINLVMGLILHSPFSSSHSHHGHSHGQNNLDSSEKQGNINVRAAVIHVLGDFIQSIGVLVAALIIKLNPDAKIADPICTFIFSIIVIFTTKNIVRDTISVLMESVPFSVNYDSVIEILSTIDGVRHVHSLHIWSLTTNKTAMTVHLAVDKFCDNEEILKTATKKIRTNFNIASITIQIEKYKSEIIGDCIECQLPKK